MVVLTPADGGGLAPPVEHELVVEVFEQALGARLHDRPLLVGQFGLGLGEQVEDRQLLFGDALDDGALFLGGEVAGELDEAAEVLVDVEAAGVVVGDQCLDAFDEVDSGRVDRCGGLGPHLQERGEAFGLGSLLVAELLGERVEVDLRQVDVRVGSLALGGGADDVLLGADRAVEQCVDGVGDVVEVVARLGRAR